MSLYFPQVRALCPLLWHLLQTRARFAGGEWKPVVVEEAAADEEAVAVEEAVADEEAVAVEEATSVEQGVADEDATAEREVSGRGQTSSCTSSGQYSRMWLYSYHCRSRDKPGGRTIGGSW